jgi:hypothetical protein
MVIHKQTFIVASELLKCCNESSWKSYVYNNGMYRVKTRFILRQERFYVPHPIPYTASAKWSRICCKVRKLRRMLIFPVLN